MSTTSFFEDKTRGPTIFKDKDEELDYSIDWNDWLEEEESILDFTLTPEAGGITKVQESQANGIVTVRVKDGTLNNTHGLTCQIVTDNGQKAERTIYFQIIER